MYAPQSIRDLKTTLCAQDIFDSYVADIAAQYSSRTQTKKDFAVSRNLREGTLDTILDYAEHNLNLPLARGKPLKISQQDKQELYGLREKTGMTYRQIAEQFGISESYAGQIYRNLKKQNEMPLKTVCHPAYWNRTAKIAGGIAATLVVGAGLVASLASTIISPKYVPDKKQAAVVANEPCPERYSNAALSAVPDRPKAAESASKQAEKRFSEPKEIQPSLESILAKKAADTIQNELGSTAVKPEVKTMKIVPEQEFRKDGFSELKKQAVPETIMPTITYKIESTPLPTLEPYAETHAEHSPEQIEQIADIFDNNDRVSIRFEKDDVARAEEVGWKEIKEAPLLAKPFVAAYSGLGKLKMGIYYTLFWPIEKLASLASSE